MTNSSLSNEPAPYAGRIQAVDGLERVQEVQRRPLNVEWVRITAQAGPGTGREFHASTPMDVYREIREIRI